MTLSIRFKAVLPGVIFGMMLLVFLTMAHYAVRQASGMTQTLAERFGEIEEVRQIETKLARLIHPHVEYLMNYDSEVRSSVASQFEALVKAVSELRSMATVNPEEREFLQAIENDIQEAQKTSNEFFTLNKANHHHAMELLFKLSTQQIEPMSQSLQIWHEGEMMEVEKLKDNTHHELSLITDWSIALIIGGVVAMLFAIWLNNNMLVKPIMSISRFASILASGNLKEQAPVFSNDEIGRLAMSINSMAASLDGLYARMDLIARSDQLTGLLNRRAFDDVSEHEFSAARRYGRNVTLVMLDADHFKNVNDTYGHAAGDAVLQYIAGCCLASVRDSDYCFRYGGEEFILLLHENSVDGALTVAERCRAAIESGTCATHGHDIRVTASFGIACYPQNGSDLTQLLSHADKALYAAKAAGRNRCISYQDIAPTE